MVTRPPENAADYTAVDTLLPFIRRFLQEKSGFRVDAVELVRDGSMRFRLRAGDEKHRLLWTEHARDLPGEQGFRGGVVGPEQTHSRRDAPGATSTRRAASHVARRLDRLLSGQPPHLLLWRNRNPQRISWGTRMFNNLCPDLLVRGKTRYHDYIVSRIDAYEGYLNIEFQSRKASVVLRLTLEEHPPVQPLMSWGPISLIMLEDERSPGQRRSHRHRVEEFLGYLLSRNLPPRFTLQFEFGDPPAGYRPPDAYVDFLTTRRLDDTSFFEMIFATPASIGVVTSCDRECFNLFSLVAAPKENWITSTPWQPLPERNYLHHCYHVNLDTRATIMGDDLLDRCLARLARADHPPELIILFDSCLHRLIGYDFQQPIDRFRRESTIPVVYYDIRTSQHPYLQQMKEFWYEVYRQTADPARSPVPGKVSFLGLHPEVAGEVTLLLESLGLEPGARLFPYLPLEELRDIRSSSLVVACDWEYVRILFSKMLPALDRPSLRLPLPYGVEGTTRWLERIVDSAGRDPAAVGRLERVERARARARRHARALAGARIGLFLRARGARNQLSSSLRFGVPLVDFLHELGLGLDLNLFVGQDENPPDPESLRPAGIDRDRGDSIGFYSDFRELPGRLRSPAFELVYTETFRDERIPAAGKIPVRLHQLHPGLAGAVRTAKVLGALLQSGFYRRYQRQLSAFCTREPFAHGSRDAER